MCSFVLCPKFGFFFFYVVGYRVGEVVHPMPAEHRYKWEDVKRGVLLSCAFFQGLHLEGRPVR